MVGTICRRTDRSRSPLLTESRVNSDGHPLNEVQYRKLILKPDRFTTAKVFLDYGKLVATTAKEFGVGFSNKGLSHQAHDPGSCVFGYR
jgi:hypothetical protein